MDTTQVVIKCGRGEGGFEYKGHYRAGLFFDQHGRECVVDDRPVAKVRAELEREQSDLLKKKLDGLDDIAKGEHREHCDRISAQLHAPRTGYVEEEGKPLVVTQKLYEYLREANGKALMFEPWNGQPRPAPAVEISMKPEDRIAKLEDGQREIRALVQQLLVELKKK